MVESLLEYYTAKARKARRRRESLDAKIEELARRDPRAMRMLHYIRLSEQARGEAQSALHALGNHVLRTEIATNEGDNE